MKTLKLEHKLAEDIKSGRKKSTWRMFDDKDLRVNDVLIAIDKVNKKDPSSWFAFGELTINKIVEKRLRDINDSDYEGHNKYNSLGQMIDTFRGFYPNQNVSPDTPVKILYFSFRQHKDPQSLIDSASQQIEADVKKSTSKVKLYTDGGSRGNPGPSASGYVLLDDSNNVLVQNGIYLGVTTNNQAEYQALKSGLEAALEMNVNDIAVFMDSMLVVNQMKGIFKVKNRDLWPIHDSIKQLAERFAKISFTHVPRELNKLADAQVNKALDDHAAEVLAEVQP